jgi:ribose transport system ATP-binding protein
MSVARISLDLVGITKVYPSAVALNRVSLGIRGGEVVGLIGENGAGKSTLMKVLGGAIAPDEGEIVIDGQSAASLTPAEALARGIAFVHQELNSPILMSPAISFWAESRAVVPSGSSTKSR